MDANSTGSKHYNKLEKRRCHWLNWKIGQFSILEEVLGKCENRLVPESHIFRVSLIDSVSLWRPCRQQNVCGSKYKFNSDIYAADL